MDKEVIELFKRFLENNNLASGTLNDGCGNKVKVKLDKHGFYKVIVTSESMEEV